MGYSISVKFKNNEEKEKMKSFLIENKYILEKMKNTHKNFMYEYFNIEVLDGKNLGYAPKVNNLLGFHGIVIPIYIWDLCAWMSVKADTKTESKKNNYFYYDDEKIIVTTDINDKKNIIVDERGIALKIEKEEISMWDMITGNKKTKNQIRDLMIQLDEKWMNELKQEENKNLNCGKKVKP